ncbi:MAG: hypothetical protein WAV93_07395 [Bacteroidales bacterium]
MTLDFVINDFWRFEIVGNSNAEVVVIDKPEFFKFLERNGFGKIYLDGEKMKPTYVRIKDNIARVVSRDTIITFSRLYIREREPESYRRNMIYSAFIETILSKPESAYSMLKVSHVEFLSDLRDTIYFYFSNKIIAVTKSGVTEISYLDAPGVIWEDQILDFNILVTEDERYWFSSDFNQFLINISKAELQTVAGIRYQSILSATGYLIHEYRDLSKMKAVILMDANLSPTPEGGAGKGLFIQAIKQVRQTVVEDGKNFTFNTRFLFQQVRPSTRVLFFDDVTKRFDFERLFSTITDGIIVERKHRDRFVIPAEKSPRIVASTNYVIIGNGGSFERRKFEFEFSSHYNRSHSPVDEFGHIFFQEWSDEEWNKFYNLIFYACKQYLNTGLVTAPSINRDLKLLIQSTSPEFFDFSQEDISLDNEYNKKDLFQTFIRQYPDFSHMKQRTFTSWLRSFAEVRNIRINERKSGENYFVRFIRD